MQCNWLNGAWKEQTSERKVAKHVRNEKCKWRNAFICRGDKTRLGNSLKVLMNANGEIRVCVNMMSIGDTHRLINHVTGN